MLKLLSNVFPNCTSYLWSSYKLCGARSNLMRTDNQLLVFACVQHHLVCRLSAGEQDVTLHFSSWKYLIVILIKSSLTSVSFLMFKNNHRTYLSPRLKWNIHHLCSSPSHSLGSRYESFSPTRVSCIKLLNGSCTLERKIKKLKIVVVGKENREPQIALEIKSMLFLNPQIQWLTFPLSTISFCKSVDALTSMRIAWSQLMVKGTN